MSTARAHSYCPLCHERYTDPRYGFCQRDGARLRPVTELGSGWIGRRIRDTYEVVRFIGRGAMAEVYEATRLATDARVALKVMQPLLVSDPVAVERFRREARLVALIDHPNVVHLDELGVLEDGTWFMVMELLRGQSLEEALATGPLPPRRAVAMARQACAALQAAHDQRVVHRDVKPANLFLQETGGDGVLVKLLDLGIAKIPGLDKESNLTATGLVFGTPEYMSPEQAQGHPVDHRSDLYSLGVVLWRALLGEPPFSGDSYVAVLTKQVTEAPVWPAAAAHRAGLPPAAERLLLRALSKNPAHRFQSAGDFAAALGELQERLDVSTAPTVSGREPVAPAVRPRATVRTVALAAATGDADHEVVELAPDVYWVGRREGVLLERNTYLRVYRGEGLQQSVLLDPGPPQDLEIVAAKVAAILGGLGKVDLVFLNHQDPDVAANAAVVQQLNPRAHVWCSADTWRLVHFYGLDPKRYSAVEHFPGHRTALVTGQAVTFVPTPYCHFRGAVMYYDLESRILFSGDLFGGLSAARTLEADADAWSGVEVFHQLYMPSQAALRHALAAVRALDPPPRFIAPQHGGLYRDAAIPQLLARLERLEVGVDLTAAAHDQERALAALRALVAGVVPLLGEERVAQELRYFGVDGTFPDLFVFAGAREIAEVKIAPRAALRALLLHLRAVMPAAQAAAFAALVESVAAAHGLAAGLRADAFLAGDDAG